MIILWLRSKRRLLEDLAERSAAAFFAGALGSVSVAALVSGDVNVWRSAGIGGATAVLELLRGMVASRRGDPGTASLLSR